MDESFGDWLADGGWLWFIPLVVTSIAMCIGCLLMVGNPV
jgi:hypothetical protein